MDLGQQQDCLQIIRGIMHDVAAAPKPLRIEFTVFGVPQPQGSSRAFVNKRTGRAAITSDNTKLKPWRQEIAFAAYEQMLECGPEPTDKPTRVTCLFSFQKPKSTKKSVTHKTTRPDVDKCLRAVLDALTGIVFRDDAQVVEVYCRKRFADVPGCQIIVEEC